MGSPDLYAILGVPPTADPAEIKRAYHFLAKAFHPDRFSDPVLKARAEDQFKALQEAYEVLSDAERRRAYDEQLRARFLPPAPQSAQQDPRGALPAPGGEPRQPRRRGVPRRP